MDGFLINFDSDLKYKISYSFSNFEVSQIVEGVNMNEYFDKMQNFFPCVQYSIIENLFGWQTINYNNFKIEKI